MPHGGATAMMNDSTARMTYGTGGHPLPERNDLVARLRVLHGSLVASFEASWLGVEPPRLRHLPCEPPEAALLHDRQC